MTDYLYLQMTDPQHWRIQLPEAPSSDPEVNLLELIATLRSFRLALLQYIAPDSCIAMTRILCLWAQYWGIHARERSVAVRVFNPAAARFAQAGMYAQDVWDRAGAHILVCGHDDAPADPERWNGHLVAILRAGGTRLMVDGSADQFNRPKFNVEIDGPIHMPWNMRGCAARSRSGVAIDYKPRADSEYKTCPDWLRTYEVTDTLKDEA